MLCIVLFICMFTPVNWLGVYVLVVLSVLDITVFRYEFRAQGCGVSVVSKVIAQLCISYPFG